ncbi:hypothetical protein IJ182_01590 [bacterium]|nr:hypothetical protein [bacterium]
MLKKFIINLLLIFIVIAAIEVCAFNKTKEENDIFKQQVKKLASNNADSFKTEYKILDDFSPSIWRNSFYKPNSNKKPFLWFGCSFAEGAGLEDKETPCYKLSKITGRSCINRSKGATGTQFVYSQLKDDNITNEIPDVDYIIYTFIWDHTRRLYLYQVNPLIYMFNIRYKLQNGKLKEIKPIFKPLYSLYFVKRILNRKITEETFQERKDYNLFNAMLQESFKISKEKYPNAKFIMIEFPELSKMKLPENEVNKLEEIGITVVDAEKLMDDIDVYNKKYWLSDDIHPTSELWDKFLPKFAELYMN